MNQLKHWIPEHIRNMHAYTPGLQLDQKVIKLNTNENPYPLPDFILKEMEKIIRENRFHLYPDPKSSNLRKKIAQLYHKSENEVLIGNGSDDILSIVFRTFLIPEEKVLVLDPSYSLYPVLCSALNANVIKVPLKKDFTVDLSLVIEYNKKYNPKMIVITNPNAPTGIALTKRDILELYQNLNKPVLIDEAYVFFGAESVMEEAGSDDYPMLMVCSTFSKAFSLAGLRLGWLIAHQKWIEEFDKIRDSYNVNLFTQKVGLLILENYSYFKNNINKIIEIRDWFIAQLKKLNFITLPSKTNFIYTSPPDKNAKDLYEYLLSKNILVRYFKENPEYLRITIGSKEQMEVLLDVLQDKYC
ncbi:MAG: histidinol-phosphate aminotransferase [Candidatus Sericytochromatia bacterium]|nr:MAG: histidinol-phosphate aminotransferase [Candidatus Sericytochromatia bacterium]